MNSELSSSTPVTPDAGAGRAPRLPLRHAFTRYKVLALLFAVVAIWAFFSVLTHGAFVTPRNVSNLLRQMSITGMLACGMVFVIIAGEIDLSIGSLLGLLGVAMGAANVNLGAPAWVLVIIGLVVGALAGAVNGLIVTRFRVPSIVVTIGTMSLYRGIAYVVLGDQVYRKYPPGFSFFGQGYVVGVVSFEFVLFLLFAIVFGVVLHLTTFGRRIYAIGNNPRVARLSGVNVGRTTIGVYVLSGVCSALVGMMLAGFSGQASLGMGDDYLLPSIAVVVIGGTLITGGRGHYLGMVGGVLLLTALQTLLAGTTTPPAIREILYGAVVLAAVVALRERAPG